MSCVLISEGCRYREVPLYSLHSPLAEEAQEYGKMFKNIERYSQLRNYFIGCHKVSNTALVWCSIQPARLAQSVEHGTLNPRVVGSSPTLGDFFFAVFSLFTLYVDSSGGYLDSTL